MLYGKIGINVDNCLISREGQQRIKFFEIEYVSTFRNEAILICNLVNGWEYPRMSVMLLKVVRSQNIRCEGTLICLCVYGISKSML